MEDSIPLAIAGVFLLIEVDAPGSLIGALFMGSVALPFWVAYLVETHTNRWALIPGWILTVIALISLLADTVMNKTGIHTLVAAHESQAEQACKLEQQLPPE